uniref:Uncharacterized protein n=1 Tax=Knipowitschia caucasica TaxID=637954 RepID=A0AAV2MTG3_KNICA
MGGRGRKEAYGSVRDVSGGLPQLLGGAHGQASLTHWCCGEDRDQFQPKTIGSGSCRRCHRCLPVTTSVSLLSPLSPGGCSLTGTQSSGWCPWGLCSYYGPLSALHTEPLGARRVERQSHWGVG